MLVQNGSTFTIYQQSKLKDNISIDFGLNFTSLSKWAKQIFVSAYFIPWANRPIKGQLKSSWGLVPLVPNVEAFVKKQSLKLTYEFMESPSNLFFN